MIAQDNAIRPASVFCHHVHTALPGEARRDVLCYQPSSSFKEQNSCSRSVGSVAVKGPNLFQVTCVASDHSDCGTLIIIW